MQLKCDIEIDGKKIFVGTLSGDNPDSCVFSYSKEYLSNQAVQPISQSLPLQNSPFSPEATRCFFDGLLPEGFTRRSVAGILNVDADNYPSILRGLGNECLGAVRLYSEDSSEPESSYQKLTETQVSALAAEGAIKAAEVMANVHLSLTGASGKVGLYYDQDEKSFYFPVGMAPSTHIVKQSHVRLDNLVVNEQLCMMTAKKLGIEVPDSFIVNPENQSRENILFVTRRYDRIFNSSNKHSINGLDVPLRLHQETFAQALCIPSEYKYEQNGQNYLKKAFDLLKAVSSSPLEDMKSLWQIIVFDFLIGNTDNHIKNLSLLYSPDLSKKRLSPAYDIVSTVIYDSTSKNMGLGINGKFAIKEIFRSDFEEAAPYLGLNKKMAMQIFDLMKNEIKSLIKESAEELSDKGFITAPDICNRILQNGGLNAKN